MSVFNEQSLILSPTIEPQTGLSNAGDIPKVRGAADSGRLVIVSAGRICVIDCVIPSSVRVRTPWLSMTTDQSHVSRCQPATGTPPTANISVLVYHNWLWPSP